MVEMVSKMMMLMIRLRELEMVPKLPMVKMNTFGVLRPNVVRRAEVSQLENERKQYNGPF